MKIEFNQEELKALLDMAHISDWVLMAYETGDKVSTEKTMHQMVIQKILAAAFKAGESNKVEYSEEDDQYFISEEYVQNGSAQKFINDYENETFWDELADRLAKTELAKEGIPENLEDYINKVFEKTEKFENEFEQHGLERLKIQE